MRKRVMQEEERHGDHLRIARLLDAITLQRAEIVRVSELAAQLLEDGPVAALALDAERVDQMPLQIVDDAIVVEKSIVDVDEEDGVVHRRCFGHEDTKSRNIMK